jgi:2-keto-4-pentenoate hydratase/2-oxohepta-3-ene-1,7-dioic acid hydratase in catechol pathway
MRFGHAKDADGAPSLFGEKDGRRLELGLLTDAGTRLLDELLSDPDQLSHAIEALERAFDQGRGERISEEERLLPPVLRPGKIVAIGLNYLDHCRELGLEPPTEPVVFAKLGTSLRGHGDDVTWDTAVTTEVDWEAELGVVIGRRTHNADAAEAARSIFGYTVVNDVTARDLQRTEQQWVRAKSLDSFCPIGPVVVTADEIDDPQALAVRSRVNGEKMQDSSTAEMIFSVVELVERLSRSFTLEPGDIIATGTPLGVGAFRDPPIFLGDGDVMEMEIEGIGILRNRCRVVTRP